MVAGAAVTGAVKVASRITPFQSAISSRMVSLPAATGLGSMGPCANAVAKVQPAASKTAAIPLLSGFFVVILHSCALLMCAWVLVAKGSGNRWNLFPYLLLRLVA